MHFPLKIKRIDSAAVTRNYLEKLCFINCVSVVSKYYYQESLKISSAAAKLIKLKSIILFIYLFYLFLEFKALQHI
jgi:hypothetical protein